MSYLSCDNEWEFLLLLLSNKLHITFAFAILLLAYFAVIVVAFFPVDCLNLICAILKAAEWHYLQFSLML